MTSSLTGVSVDFSSDVLKAINADLLRSCRSHSIQEIGVKCGVTERLEGLNVAPTFSEQYPRWDLIGFGAILLLLGPNFACVDIGHKQVNPCDALLTQ